MPYAPATENDAGAITTYSDDLTCYVAWPGAEHLRLGVVTAERLQDDKKSLEARVFAPTTVARRMTVMRGLHRFLIAAERSSRDTTSPDAAIRPPEGTMNTCQPT